MSRRNKWLDEAGRKDTWYITELSQNRVNIYIKEDRDSIIRVNEEFSITKNRACIMWAKNEFYTKIITKRFWPCGTVSKMDEQLLSRTYKWYISNIIITNLIQKQQFIERAKKEQFVFNTCGVFWTCRQCFYYVYMRLCVTFCFVI